MKRKINVYKSFLEIEEIEVDLPFYYKSDNEGSFDSFGIITDDTWSVINKYEDRYEISKYFNIDLSNPAQHGLSSYFNEGKSSKTEFERNKKECLNFLNNL